MAPRQTARRLLVALPALALALGVTACSPPNEVPANPDAPYTLPSYTLDPTTAKTTTPAPESAGGVDAAEEEYIDGTPTVATTPADGGYFGDTIGEENASGQDGAVVPSGARMPGGIANN